MVRGPEWFALAIIQYYFEPSGKAYTTRVSEIVNTVQIVNSTEIYVNYSLYFIAQPVRQSLVPVNGCDGPGAGVICTCYNTVRVNTYKGE